MIRMLQKYRAKILKEFNGIGRKWKRSAKKKQLEFLLRERRLCDLEISYGTRMYEKDWPIHKLTEERRDVFRRLALQRGKERNYIDRLIEGLFAGK